MRTLILFLFITSNFTNLVVLFETIDRNPYIIEQDKYVLIVLGNVNCKDCIPTLTNFFKANNVSKDKIYFYIESTNEVYQKIYFRNLIKNNTDYYNRILFNPNNVDPNNQSNSYFLKQLEKPYTPVVYFHTDTSILLKYSEIFAGNKVIIDTKYLLNLKSR